MYGKREYEFVNQIVTVIIFHYFVKIHRFGINQMKLFLVLDIKGTMLRTV